MSSASEETKTEEALRNPLILHEIFKYMYFTKWKHSLLSSCSLVNTAWNRAARTFIRDHGKCTTHHSKGKHKVGGISACQFLNEFFPMCSRMTEKGRVIPWNRFKLDFLIECDGTCEENFHDGIQSFRQFQKELKVKHLEISWPRYQADVCLAAKSLCKFFIQKQNAALLTFRTNHLLPMEEIFLGNDDDWRLHFPKLEEISIDRVDSDDLEREKIIVEKILEGSPNYRRICANEGNLEMLQIFPDAELVLLQKLKVDLQRFLWMEEEAIQKVLAHRPPLKKLTFVLPYSDEPAEQEESDIFYAQVQQLLQNSLGSLKEIFFQNPHPCLCKFLTPQLVHLRKLEFWNQDEELADECWELMSAINYDRFVPHLEEVSIELDSNSSEWPQQLSKRSPGNEVTVNRCNSAIRLKLHLKVARVNLSDIKTVFPNVFNLDLFTYPTTGYSTPDKMPLQGIFENWPALETLELCVQRNILCGNLDSEICGIHPEEVELLWEMDVEDMKAVHIVPIRPCILTMTSLGYLDMSLSFFKNQRLDDSKYTLHPVTLVSQLLVSQRISNARICELF